MKLSTFLSLNQQDFVKGLILSVLVAVLTVIQATFAAGIFTVDWQNIGAVAATAFVAYLSKNLFTPTPKSIEIDPTKTIVVDEDSKKILLRK